MIQPSTTMAHFKQSAGRSARTPTLHQLAKPESDCAADSALQARAAKNYPDNPYLQTEYIRAVGVVRATKGGWVMDLRPLPPVPARFQQ